MSWSKILIERLFSFLATLIPGGAVLMLFVLHPQSALTRLWSTEAIGYETKIGISVLCTFVAGFTVHYALGVISSAIGGGIRGLLGLEERGFDQEQLQPWRNPVWRALLKAHLGPAAPSDIRFISQEELDKKLELISIQHAGDEEQRVAKVLDATRDKIEANLADYQWATWWDQLHVPALLGRTTLVGIVSSDLVNNFETASLILLAAMPWTPSLRRWWVISFCVWWIVSLALRMTYVVATGRDAWSSFQSQINYLRSLTEGNTKNE